MAEPMSVKLSGVDGVYRVSDLGQKKILKKEIEFFFDDFFACNLTLTHLCPRDNSLGFEDCRLATHLLN